MAAKPMDAVASFQYLVDNIPEWKSSVTTLTVYASQRHAEFVAEYTRVLANVRPKRTKSPSLASIHDADDQEPLTVPVSSSDALQSTTSPDLVDISPFEAGNRYLYAQAKLKRKIGSSVRSGASGPTRFRNKQMAVIYYDSYIQSELEKMCRNVSAARNNLRKGKNSYTACNGFQLPSLGHRYDHMLSASLTDDMMTPLMLRRATKTSKENLDTAIVSAEPPSGEASFALVDKRLETIHSLCETAAHQVIRDGDCKVELENVIKNLEILSPLADSILQNMKAEQIKERISTDEGSIRGVSRKSSQTALSRKLSHEPLNPTAKNLSYSSQTLQKSRHPTISPIISTMSAPALTTEIEVDDDDDDDQSSIEIDIGRSGMGNPTRIRI